MSNWNVFDHIATVGSFMGVTVFSAIRYVRKMKHMTYAFLKPYILTSVAILGISLMATIYFAFDWYNIFHPSDVRIVYVDSSKNRNEKSKPPVDTIVKTRIVYVKPTILKPLEPAPKIQVDTSKKIPNNGILSTGADAHNVAGTNNSVGVNGDVYLNEEKRLGEGSLKNIGDAVNDLVVNKKFENNISVVTETTCNYPKISQQIIEYLKNRGFKAAEAFVMGISTKAVGIDTTHRFPFEKRQIKIYVGRFD